MNLKSGERLGPYEIIAPLGAGGMGEVYRARDPRLNRTVAIKVLPPEVSADAKFRLRFEREARAISSLSHPHICSVYDVGHENGRDYLVMEYIEGETLSQRLARGPLPIDQVIRFGIDIADALEKAHRQGIIHRDLKPSNIMITKSGAKLLDFGLAKTMGVVETSRSAAAVDSATEEGTIVGTFHYMAPEQVEGRASDQRSDIFALGTILYEMATGRRAFEGESKASLIAAILDHQPPPILTLQPLAPPLLDRVVRSCLAKDPDERIQTARDVQRALRWIVDGISDPSLSMPVPARRKPASRAWIALGTLIVLGTATTGLILRYVAGPSTSTFRAERFELQPPDGVRVAETNDVSVLAISPDGEWVAFLGVSEEPNRSGGIYLRSTKELGARLVAGSMGGSHNPFFSPDSRWLGFWANDFLQKIPVSGGEPERICPAPRLRGASWGEDGKILFSAGEGLLLVSADGGRPQVLTTPPAGQRHYWPQLLPGGKHVLFVVHQGASDSHRKIAVLSLKDRKLHPLVSGTSPHYVRGHLVYGYLGMLQSAPFDRVRLKLTGKPKMILDDVYFYGRSAFTAFDISASGSLVYIPGAPKLRETDLLWVDREANLTRAVEDRRPYKSDGAVISPDGKQFAVVIASSLEDYDLWIYDTEERRWARLTRGKRVETPRWSPDGRHIVFTSFESAHAKLWRVSVDGASRPEQLTSGVHWEHPGGISARDQVIIFMRLVEAGQWDLLTLPLRGGSPQPFLTSPALEAWPAFSPDGQWVAYESGETGGPEIHVRPYPGPGKRVTISSGGGHVPLWSRDGRELYYRKENEIWAAPVTVRGGITAGSPKRLFRGDFLGRQPWESSVDVSADGRFLIVSTPPEVQQQRRLAYIPNWTRELKQIGWRR